MPYYLINRQADEHNLNEVHQTTCPWKPAAINQVNLGYFPSNKAAVEYAKSIGWKNADGCWHCCRDAHHG